MTSTFRRTPPEITESNDRKIYLLTFIGSLAIVLAAGLVLVLVGHQNLGEVTGFLAPFPPLLTILPMTRSRSEGGRESQPGSADSSAATAKGGDESS